MFISEVHKERFAEFLNMDKTSPMDQERRSLFYIIAGCIELSEKVNYFYDFTEHSIRLEAFKEVDLASGSSALLMLAFNLYNNSPCGPIVLLFAALDEVNRRLALEAIRIRFKIA